MSRVGVLMEIGSPNDHIILIGLVMGRDGNVMVGKGLLDDFQQRSSRVPFLSLPTYSWTRLHGSLRLNTVDL